MTGKKAETLNQRIRADLESRILSGQWEPGFRIPYEHELMEQYGCSRITPWTGFRSTSAPSWRTSPAATCHRDRP